MAAWTTGKSRRRLFNSPAKGGADSGVRSADRSAADPVPGRAATSGDGLKENLESRRKRGAWTAAEDAELSAYVAKFGAGDWKHVADATALKRDAQSCRLRWSSYLNPKPNSLSSPLLPPSLPPPHDSAFSFLSPHPPSPATLPQCRSTLYNSSPLFPPSPSFPILPPPNLTGVTLFPLLPASPLPLPFPHPFPQ
ncbi:unnamed protein product [Closterium sp. NIES-53]